MHFLLKKRKNKVKIQINKRYFGYIYLATNTLNDKVYIGKTEFPRTIIDRWKEHLKEGRHLKKLRLRHPYKKFSATHLNNAIAKYGEKIWNVKEIDIALSSEELSNKENSGSENIIH